MTLKSNQRTTRFQWAQNLERVMFNLKIYNILTKIQGFRELHLFGWFFGYTTVSNTGKSFEYLKFKFCSINSYFSRFFYLLVLITFINVSIWLCVQKCSCLSDTEVSEPLEVELRAIMSCVTWAQYQLNLLTTESPVKFQLLL